MGIYIIPYILLHMLLSLHCKVWAVEVDISPSLSAGVSGSLGLGVAGGRARAPGIGATVMKDAVNICLWVYLGILALQSRFKASCV
jgi:hypothetical protein